MQNDTLRDFRSLAGGKQGRQKSHPLLESVHLHPKESLEAFVTGSRRGFDAILLPGASRKNAEKEELENRQYRNDAYVVHSDFFEDGAAI